MVTVAPESAASMHGPNPASYWRSSSWADKVPVNATLETWLPSIRVTETSAAPVIVCLASSATRPRTSDSCSSLSMILLSSANAARGSSGGSDPPMWGVDMVPPASGRTAGSDLATIQEGGAVGRSRAKSRDESREGRCYARPGVGRRKRRQLAACVQPTGQARRYSPIRCPGRIVGDCRYVSGSGDADEGLSRAETGTGPPAGGLGGGPGAPTVPDEGTSAKEFRCPCLPPPPAGSPSWHG